MARDDTYDMALIKVAAPAGLKIGSPIKVDGKCDAALRQEIYAVGFPGVGKRRSLRLGREVKRWSKGDYVGLGRADERGVTATYIASTVELVAGQFGRPGRRCGGCAGRRGGERRVEPGERIPLRRRPAQEGRLAVVPRPVPGGAAHHGAERPRQ